MSLAWHLSSGQIAAAIGLDLLFGDPRWLPHPVRIIGAAIAAGDKRLHTGMAKSDLVRGAALALSIIAAAPLTVWAAIALAAILGQAAGSVVAVLLAWTTLGMRGLNDAALEVESALRGFDDALARHALPALVGRDPDTLDRQGVIRATIESVAENASDGVVAPLFYLFAAGPAGAMAYKAINTLDSMIGHRDDRYIFFGRVAARIDDAANYIPARLTAACLAVNALPLGTALQALNACIRDGRLHSSPNAGYPEATIAGALGLWLGGDASYRGEIEHRPCFNTSGREATADDIQRARRLMLATSVLAFCTLALSGWAVAKLRLL